MGKQRLKIRVFEKAAHEEDEVSPFGKVEDKSEGKAGEENTMFGLTFGNKWV